MSTNEQLIETLQVLYEGWRHANPEDELPEDAAFAAEVRQLIADLRAGDIQVIRMEAST